MRDDRIYSQMFKDHSYLHWVFSLFLTVSTSQHHTILHMSITVHPSYEKTPDVLSYSSNPKQVELASSVFPKDSHSDGRRCCATCLHKKVLRRKLYVVHRSAIDLLQRSFHSVYIPSDADSCTIQVVGAMWDHSKAGQNASLCQPPMCGPVKKFNISSRLFTPPTHRCVCLAWS